MASCSTDGSSKICESCVFWMFSQSSTSCESAAPFRAFAPSRTTRQGPSELGALPTASAGKFHWKFAGQMCRAPSSAVSRSPHSRQLRATASSDWPPPVEGRLRRCLITAFGRVETASMALKRLLLCVRSVCTSFLCKGPIQLLVLCLYAFLSVYLPQEVPHN